MPNIKSAMKRVRQDEKRRMRNKSYRTKVKTMRRQLFEAVEKKDESLSTDAYRNYCSALDKAAKKGVIKKNTAIRRKHRAAEKVKAIA